MKRNSTFFAPELYFKEVAPVIGFYKKAFDAIELRCWSNDNGSVHVAEMSIDGALFHLHEETLRKNLLSPKTLQGTTTVIGLFINDPHAVMAKAVAAGGTETEPVKDHDYAYRQGSLIDPFGHHWQIQKKI